jgi:hypothetical protein
MYIYIPFVHNAILESFHKKITRWAYLKDGWNTYPAAITFMDK